MTTVFKKKTHTWRAVRGPRLWAVPFCVGRAGASPLMITHSTSSVFHLHRVPDPQPAVRPESTTLMSSSTPRSRHWFPFFVSACRACQRWKEWRAKPGCTSGGPELALGASTVAPRVFHRTALPCLSADIPECVYKDVFWQIVMWELCLSACCSRKTRRSGAAALRLLKLESTWCIFGVRMWLFRGVIFKVCWSGEETCQ